MNAEPAPVFCAAHELASWDERQPQAAFAELAGQATPVRPDGTLVVAARQEMAEFLRHPAVRATDGVHYNLGGKRPPPTAATWPGPRSSSPVTSGLLTLSTGDAVSRVW